MSARDIFSLKVIRCPGCHARLPVQGAESVVRCEYCDARVQLGPESSSKQASAQVPRKRKQAQPKRAPTPDPAPLDDSGGPELRATPQFSGCAWILFMMPLLATLGSIVPVLWSLDPVLAEATWARVVATWDDLAGHGPAAPRRSERGAPELPGASELGDENDENDENDEPGRVGRLFQKLEDREETDDGQEAKGAGKKAARPRPVPAQRPAKRPATSNGPVLSVAEARALLEPEARKCLEEASRHRVTVHLGNDAIGGVSILERASTAKPRIDGVEARLSNTPLGRCINLAGSRIRTKAFGGDSVRLDVRNPKVRDPLAGLPQTPPTAAIAEVLSARDEALRSCASRHRESGRATTINITIDGPTGRLVSARPNYTGAAFNRCAQTVYRDLEFPKAQRFQVNYTHRVQL